MMNNNGMNYNNVNGMNNGMNNMMNQMMIMMQNENKKKI